jgi:nicotinate-nucleotide adenylyltransferase
MSRIGIYGGTFDPIHHGHLITAQSVKELRKLDKIVFIPSYISPHKKDLKASASEHRINMLKLAVRDVPYFDWSDFEITRENISYTIDTLQEMKKHYDEIELILGADNMRTFDTWKSPDQIVKLATLIVLRRRTDSVSNSDNKYAENAVFLETPRIDISGTIIRRRVREGLPIDFLVPQNVMKYIYNFKLYKD